MQLSLDEVRHLAMLARLGLSSEEMEHLREQMSSILEHMNMLSELDTEAIAPTASVVALQDVFAADVPRPSCSPDEMLKNAPDREGNYFKVSSVLGYET